MSQPADKRFRTLCVDYVAPAEDPRTPQQVDDDWSDLWDEVVAVFERHGFTVDGGSCGPTDEHYRWAAGPLGDTVERTQP